MKNKFTDKQIQVLKDDARILVLHGAKRTGKTYILILKFIMLISKFKGKGYKFIIGGATSSTIRTNILDDMEILLGHEITVSKDNSFKLFGNKVLVRAGSDSGNWKGVRGFTSHGALLNEGTALNDVFIKECISRCSGAGSEIYIDTNPENPMHSIKRDYIDKSGELLSDGKLNINSIHFQLEDNKFLDREYVESIKMSTPTGVFYDRDILGLWVNSEGVVYKDFDKKIHLIESIPENEDILYYTAGVDWGFRHFGSIVVMAKCVSGNYYLVEEIARKEEHADYWCRKMLELQEKYKTITFYCDYENQEHIEYCKKEGVNVKFAVKSVRTGIDCVGRLLKTGKLKFLASKFKRGFEEMSLYCWSNKGDEVLKVNDDVLDSVRYALFSDMQTKKIMFIDPNDIF